MSEFKIKEPIDLFEILKNTKLVVTDIKEWPGTEKYTDNGEMVVTGNLLNKTTVTVNPEDYVCIGRVYKGQEVYVTKRLNK